jgi:hypothetical protein
MKKQFHKITEKGLSRITILLFAFLLIATGIGAAPNLEKAEYKKSHNKSQSVFICDSKTSYAYHSTADCRGLNRCTHQIVKVSEDEAKQNGRRPCKLCW